MKQIATAVFAKVSTAAATAAAASGGMQVMVTESLKLQPQHKTMFHGRHLQDDSSVTIGGTAFFDINGNGKIDLNQGDGNINPINNSAISVMTELWSCDTGQNLGYQLTDESGKYMFTVPAQSGRACYYVRYDSSTMEGTFSCSGQPKCATNNLMLSAGEEALDIDVGIQASDFAALAAELQEDIIDEEPTNDDGDGWSVVSGGAVFEPMTYAPTYVPPSRPSPSVSTPPPTSVLVTSIPIENEDTPIPTNSPSVGIPVEDSDGTDQLDSDGTDQQSSSSSGLIQLNSQIRVMLSNIASTLDDNSEELFEDVCDTFLNEQLAIATPPISYISCAVVNQSVMSGGRQRLRKLEYVERLLTSTVAVEVDVTGVALPTRTITTEEQVKFTDKLVGVFTTQGDQFLRLLKKEEAKVVLDFNDAMFPTLDRVWAVKIVDDSEGGVMISNESDGSSMSVAVIAGIAAGGAVFLLLMIILVVRCKSKKREQQDVKISTSDETTSSPISPNNVSRASHNVGYFSTPMYSSSGVEVDRRGVSPTDMTCRVQRDVIAPPGKLRILIANTQGFGPAIHTIKPNSPVEGLLFVGDIIVAVNNTNTRKSKADEITRLLRVTVKEERKITVLSLRR